MSKREYNNFSLASISYVKKRKEGTYMLGTIAIILIILWLLGVVSATTMGGFIHVLLVIAVVLILLRLIGGRKIV
jgi:lipopolysaccharide export LptBFGC system permease protein LptF